MLLVERKNGRGHNSNFVSTHRPLYPGFILLSLVLEEEKRVHKTHIWSAKRSFSSYTTYPFLPPLYFLSSWEYCSRPRPGIKLVKQTHKRGKKTSRETKSLPALLKTAVPEFHISALLSQNSRDIFFSPNGTGTAFLSSADKSFRPIKIQKSALKFQKPITCSSLILLYSNFLHKYM